MNFTKVLNSANSIFEGAQNSLFVCIKNTKRLFRAPSNMKLCKTINDFAPYKSPGIVSGGPFVTHFWKKLKKVLKNQVLPTLALISRTQVSYHFLDETNIQTKCTTPPFTERCHDYRTGRSSWLWSDKVYPNVRNFRWSRNSGKSIRFSSHRSTKSDLIYYRYTFRIWRGRQLMLLKMILSTL